MAESGLRTAGFYSLFSRFNKTKGKSDDTKEDGVVESLSLLTLDKKDDELLAYIKKRETLYDGSTLKQRIHGDGDINQRYWVGRQFPDTEYENGKRPLTDNVTFEAFETMIPQATQKNPEPIVLTDNSLDMQELGDKVHMALEYVANFNHLKTKLKKATRYWGLRFVGCVQVGYSFEENEITYKVINPKDLIFDIHSYIEDGEYYGESLGLKLHDTGENLITRFPNKKQEIERFIGKDKLGSIVTYTQFWTDEFLVFKLKDIILRKTKNPHWNYDEEVESVDGSGQPTKTVQPGYNHLSRPKMPFMFLTVFDLGDEPADKTSLISQGLVTQDNINKRLKQIDRNTDNINGGVVVNGLMFNKEQAAQVAEARRQGRTIVTPGKPADAIYFPDNKPLPTALYDSLNDSRQRFMSRFGVSGSTAENVSQQETVRGKIIVSQADTSRTGGGVTEYLELMAARIFDYTLQMMYVYWKEPHWISVVGPDNAAQVVSLEASEFPQDRKFIVTVQNGSMIPKDELSIYNEAQAQWEAEVIDPLSYYEKLKDTNPQDKATKLLIYKSNPIQYMQMFLQPKPEATAAMQPQIPEQTQGGGTPPSAVPQPQSAQGPVQQQESALIKSVPEPKI